MLHQPLFISCDVHRVYFPGEAPTIFPQPGEPGYDRSIHAVRDVRTDAIKIGGWGRIEGMDVCPRCDRKLTTASSAMLAKLKGGE